MTVAIFLFATGHIHIPVWNLVPTAAYTKTDGGCRQRDTARRLQKVCCCRWQSNTGRNLPFNLYAKRSIEHIVILIGRVDKTTPGTTAIRLYAGSFAILREGRSGQREQRARKARKIYSTRFSSSSRHALQFYCAK